MNEQTMNSSPSSIIYRIRLIFHGNRQNLVSQNFYGFYFRGMWALFPDLLNLIFVVFYFANGHRKIREIKSTAKPKTYRVCLGPMQLNHNMSGTRDMQLTYV